MGRAAEGWRVERGRRDGEPLYVRFRHAGRRYFLSTGERDPVAAARAAGAIYAEVVAGRRRSGSAGVTARTPIDELVATYLEHIEATGTRERYTMQLQHFRVHILRFFRGLAEIASVAAWADFEASRRRKGVGARTIAKELSSLRSFAKWCRARGLIEAVPDHRGPRPRSDFKALCLEPVQIDAIIAALPEKVVHGKCAGQPIRARFVFAWETALRPATIERLKVEDYDRARKRVTIRDSADKARFGRELPLTERAWKALEGVCPKFGADLRAGEAARDAEGRGEGVRAAGCDRASRDAVHVAAFADHAPRVGDHRSARRRVPRRAQGPDDDEPLRARRREGRRARAARGRERRDHAADPTSRYSGQRFATNARNRRSRIRAAATRKRLKPPPIAPSLAT